MKLDAQDAMARMAAGDPGRAWTVDEQAQGELRQRLRSEPSTPPAVRWRERLRSRLRSLVVYLPLALALAGGALCCEPALCTAAACQKAPKHSHVDSRSTVGSTLRPAREPLPPERRVDS